MARTVYCKPLTAPEYAPYGGIISSDIVTDRTVSVNNGTGRRTPEVVQTTNLYAQAPSQTPARVVLNASLGSPREVESWGESELGETQQPRRVLKVNIMERHRYSTQSFIPMGANVKYLVLVTDGGDSPNMENLRGFIATDKQGICYLPGVWHAPMSVIDNPVSYAVVQHINGVPDEDCQFFPLEEEINLVF